MGFSEVPRKSVVAGRFYPDDAALLRAEVCRFLALKPRKLVKLEGKEILAVLMPHAGYVYSGPVAGVTLGRTALPDHIIVLGPNHTGSGAPLSIWSGGPWQTPLGEMAVDGPLRQELVGSGWFTPDTAAHAREHSLEVLVPFFQVMNPKAHIVPVTVSPVPSLHLKAAGEALAEVVSTAAAKKEKVLIVVSSDMSHYLPHNKAVVMDGMALEALRSLDPEVYFETIRHNEISMCGVFPMTLALHALKALSVDSAKSVAYATSGQTGRAVGADMNNVVGYAGVLFTRNRPLPVTATIHRA